MIIIIKETAAGRLIYCKDVKRMRYGQTGEDTPQYTDRLRCAFYPSLTAAGCAAVRRSGLLAAELTRRLSYGILFQKGKQSQSLPALRQ